MKVLQYSAPFQNPIIVNLEGKTYVQIGIECPHSVPFVEKGEQPYVLSINGTRYTLGYKDILEFENLDFTRLTINILSSNTKYLILNIAYE